MSSMRKGAKYLAMFAAGSMALAACSTGGDTGDDEGADSGTTEQTITVGYEQEFGSYNNNTDDENASKNTIVLTQVMRGFWDFEGETGAVAPDTEYGTFEKTSDDPLKVKYTFDENAVWSDDEPIDCDDFLLTWAALSGTYMTGEKDAEGNDIPIFASPNIGYPLMEKPQCEDGDKEIEVTYTDTFADWQGVFGGSGVILPAHVVEQEAGVGDLIEAIESDNIEDLTKAGDFWKTGWVLNPGELKPEIMPASGPYKIASWEAGQSLTLEANDKWWGTPPKASTIVIRFISGEQTAQALQNNEVQLIAPQPQVDLVAQLEAIGEAVTVLGGDDFSYEHLDYNFTGAFADPELRKAFAMCVPRQTIIDNLIKPVSPNAEVMNSRYVYPFSPNYTDVAEAITDGSYDEVDIAGSKAIVDAKGKANMTVRIGYQLPNPRRTATVSLIRDSCAQAGFDVQDAGQEDFFGNGLANGNFDVALFAWAGSPLVTGSSTTFVTGGSNNNGKYANPEVDSLTQKLDVTPDPEEQTEIIKEIETILWDDLATIPLFAHPGVVAYASNLEGVEYQPSQTEVFFGFNNWNLAT